MVEDSSSDSADGADVDVVEGELNDVVLLDVVLLDVVLVVVLAVLEEEEGVVILGSMDSLVVSGTSADVSGCTGRDSSVVEAVLDEVDGAGVVGESVPR